MGRSIGGGVVRGGGRVLRWVKAVPYTVWDAASLNQEVDLSGFPSGPVLVFGAAYELDTEFSDAGGAAAMTSYAARIGIAGATAELINEVDLFTGAGAGFKWTVGSAETAPKIYAAGLTPRVRAAASHNLSTATQGLAQVHIYYMPLSQVT